mgnify:CR=1 FL=1
MKIRIRFTKLDWKPVLKYTSLILLSVLFITTLLIALPLTEKLSNKVSFNLNSKDSKYWSKEYTLQLNSKEKKDVNKTKEIIYRRLNRFGVERVAIRSEEGQEDTSLLKVTVNTSKEEELVKQLISTRHYYKIVTRKDDVNFEDEQNPYVVVFGENYNPTDFDWNMFRNVHIPRSKLKSGDGQYRYFAIFKQKQSKDKQFRDFLKENQLKIVGMQIDFFVTPFQTPDFTEGMAATPSVTIPLYTETEKETEAVRILYTAGKIPVEYSLLEEKELDSNMVKLEYVKISLAFGIALITTYIYLLIFKHANKDILIKSLLTTILTITFYLSYLKLSHIPVDTFILAVQFIITSIFVLAIVANRDSEILLVIGGVAMFGVVALLGTGFLALFGQGMIALIAFSKLTHLLSKWYIDNIRKI